MKSFTYLLCLFLLGSYSCTPSSDSTGSTATTVETKVPVSEEEKAINKVVLDAYAAISFVTGTTPDYEALKALFTPEATLYNFRGDSMEFFNINAFVTEFKRGIDDGEMLAFREVELGGETEYFGNIGHRISAYASYFDGANEVGEKGVNSFQVLKVNGKWLINSITWDVEKPGQPIPERYLSE